MQQAMQEVIQELDNIKNKKDLNYLKTQVAKKHKLKQIPTNLNIYLSLKDKDRSKYVNLLSMKPIRSQAGVSVVAAMIAPYGCPHGRCTMCPTFKGVTQSYTGNEPASKRGLRNKWNPYLQVFNRIQQYNLLGKDTSKIEFIIMGGNFPTTPLWYQDFFVTYALKAMNDFSSLFHNDMDKFLKFFEIDVENVLSDERTHKINDKISKLIGESTLEKEKSINKDSTVRCVAMVIETKPDSVTEESTDRFLNFGVTRMEVGAQSLYDPVLTNLNRGHDLKQTVKSTKLLKDACFKVGYHMLLGAPGSSIEKDIQMMKELFENPDFKPDFLKIYPCLVFPNTELYEGYKQGKFTPMTTEEAAKLISEVKKFIPKYCRIMRVQRDIPSYLTEAGVDRTNLRQYIRANCKCIRCRQPKADYDFSKAEIKINVQEYEASEGKEFFISADDESTDTLLGFARLRLPSKGAYRKEITENTALLRELHVYSSNVVKIGGQAPKTEVQHKGLGKKLMLKAEELAKQHNKSEMIVISGLGVKRYYENKLDYQEKGPYMFKKLS